MVAHAQQQHKAAKLTDNRGQSRPGNAQIVHEYQDRVKHHIDDSARDDANHTIDRISLKTNLVVQHQRRRHKRCPKQDDA